MTIPVLPFETGGSITLVERDNNTQKRLVDKIQAYLEVVTKAGLNLDTGHAWATRDPVDLLPLKLKDRIFGLHLKDNDSDQNKPLAPGKGTINWKIFLENMDKIGYSGSLDIEIGCSLEQVRAEYRNGLDYLKMILYPSG